MKSKCTTTFLAPGLHKTLLKLASEKRVRISRLIEHILVEVASSGQLEALCRDLVPLPSEQRNLVENVSQEPLGQIRQAVNRAVPRRATAVVHRLDGDRNKPNRREEFEKLKSLFEYPGTYLDEECSSAEIVFLNAWGSFSENEKKELVNSVDLRASIYAHWKKSHADLTESIRDAETRLARNTGRAHRMINAELRRLRALRAEFEKKVRWELRRNLVG